jgi:hypothetical protein
MPKIVSGFGPYDTEPQDCWDVHVQYFPVSLDEAQVYAEVMWENNINHPESQYYWTMVLEDTEDHPVLECV